jgi:hypothetical protein
MAGVSAPEPRRTVCVLGFGRSGTSLTMQLLATLGVGLGDTDDLLRPHEADNARGYWEPRWMVELNDELLGALGTTWWQPFPGDPGWERSPRLASLRARAQSLYEQKLGHLPLAGVKDPRTTLTLPFWQEIIPDPLYVICVRNPTDAIASIQRRPEPTLPTRAWGELWLEYTARALQGTAGRRRTLIFYEDYFRDARAQVARLGDLLGIDCDDERITRLIEQDLRHHRSSLLELSMAPGLSAPVRTVFLALRAAQQLRNLARAEADSVAVCDAIEQIVVDAWCASRDETAMRQRVEALERAQEHADALALELTRTQRELASREGELDELRSSARRRMTSALRRMRQRST